MCKKERQRHITELETMIKSDPNIKIVEFQARGDSTSYQININSWQSTLLNNFFTSGFCQIFECVYNASNSVANEKFITHKHAKSREIFYQLEGETEFADGTILKQGELKVIEANKLHACKLTPDSSCIIIVHPPFETFPNKTTEDTDINNLK